MSSSEARTARAKEPRPTVGFGCPDEVDPHHVVVDIPRGRTEPVRIAEHFGLRAEQAGVADEVDRIVLDRGKWTAIAEAARNEFNPRLKEKGIATGRWQVGENRVERLLGKELCVLAWAVERADAARVPVAITNWLGLRPEERWWLFTMTAAATGGVDDADLGWRVALRYALTENPTDAEAAERRSRPRVRRASPEVQPTLFPTGGNR